MRNVYRSGHIANTNIIFIDFLILIKVAIVCFSLEFPKAKNDVCFSLYFKILYDVVYRKIFCTVIICTNRIEYKCLYCVESLFTIFVAYVRNKYYKRKYKIQWKCFPFVDM